MARSKLLNCKSSEEVALTSIIHTLSIVMRLFENLRRKRNAREGHSSFGERIHNLILFLQANKTSGMLKTNLLAILTSQQRATKVAPLKYLKHQYHLRCRLKSSSSNNKCLRTVLILFKIRFLLISHL